MNPLDQAEFERQFKQINPTKQDQSMQQAVLEAESLANEHYYLLNDFANPYCHESESIQYDAYESTAHFLIQQKELDL